MGNSISHFNQKEKLYLAITFLNFRYCFTETPLYYPLFSPPLSISRSYPLTQYFSDEVDFYQLNSAQGKPHQHLFWSILLLSQRVKVGP